MTSRVDWIAGPGVPVAGDVAVPGDKSISHRAILLSSIARGTSRVDGFLEGEDTRATEAIMRTLGVRIDAPADGVRVVHGVGLHGLRAPATPLDCGNAGTGMRLLAGMLAAQRFDSLLLGDASLSRRPMLRVIEPLAQMGARIESREGHAPLQVRGGRALHGVDIDLAVASAQVKSAILLAGLYAQGETVVREPHSTRDYTERMLRAMGADIDATPGQVRVRGGNELDPRDVQVPADFSSAAFPLVAACIVPGSALRIRQVGLHPRRTGLLRALRAMGASIEEHNAGDADGEPIADLVVRHAPLHGIELPAGWVPDMIDEFPALFVAAACASGATRITGAAELRVKESDRLAAMADGLRALGIGVAESADGAVVHGGNLLGGRVDSRGDHRIAMAFAVAAQRAGGEVRIADVANVATSFPGFATLARSIGLNLREAWRPATRW